MTRKGLLQRSTHAGGGNLETKIIEPTICAMRGRNPDNPSNRTKGCPTEQRLEIGSNVSNTLTSVQKDNLVAEPFVLTPKRTEYGKAIRKQYEAGLVHESRHNMTELEPRKDGISNTLTTVQKDNLVGEPMSGTIWGSKQEHCSVRDDGICPTLTEAMGMGGGQIPMHNYDFRIRKLTPRECFRLMDFDDEDFDKAKAAGVSDSQLYKQAGNSIVVAVLEAIFKEML